MGEPRSVTSNKTKEFASQTVYYQSQTCGLRCYLPQHNQTELERDSDSNLNIIYFPEPVNAKLRKILEEKGYNKKLFDDSQNLVAGAVHARRDFRGGWGSFW